MNTTTQHTTLSEKISHKSRKRRAFRKRDRRWLILIVAAGLLVLYHRPVNLQDLTDPGDHYFDVDVPQSQLSAWEDVNDRYNYRGDMYGENVDDKAPQYIQTISDLDTILGEDQKKPREGSVGDVKYRDVDPADVVYDYFVYSGQDIVEVYRDNLAELFDGSTGSVLQDEMDYLAELIDGKALYPRAFTYSDTIPYAVQLQGFVRVVAWYSASVCEAGDTEQCIENFVTLFEFTQKYKKSGSMTAMLIGNVFEVIALNRLEALEQNSVDLSALKSALAKIDYLDVQDAYTHAVKSEYQTFKNTLMQSVKSYKFDYYGYSSFDLIANLGYPGESLGLYESYDNLVGIAKATHIPLSRFLNIPETLQVGRAIFYEGMNKTLAGEEFAIDVDQYWPGPNWSRSNIAGYAYLRATLPQVDMILARMQNTQQQFEEFVGR